MPENPEAGLYDLVLSERFSQAIEKNPSLHAHKDPLENDAGVRLLSQHLNQLFERALRGKKTTQQIELTNRLIQVMVQHTPGIVGRPSDQATGRYVFL